MPELGNAACLAKEAIEIGTSRQGGGPRHFESDQAVQLWVARLVHGTEGPRAERFQQFKLSQPALVLERQGGSRLYAETGATAGTGNRFLGEVRVDRDRVLTMRANNEHPAASAVRT